MMTPKLGPFKWSPKNEIKTSEGSRRSGYGRENGAQ
jgi:hypothetical protein